MKAKARVAAAVLMGAAALGGGWKRRAAATAPFRDPAEFEKCRPLPGTTYEWRGLSLTVPEGWSVREQGPVAGDKTYVLIVAPPGSPEPMSSSVVLSQEPGLRLEADSPFPSSVRELTVADRRAVLFVGRRTDIHDGQEWWAAHVDLEPTLRVQSPEHTYPETKRRNMRSEYCVFWSVLNSLRRK